MNKKHISAVLSSILISTLTYGQAMVYSRFNNDPASAAAAGSTMLSSTQLTVFNNMSLLPFSEDGGAAGLSFHNTGEPNTTMFTASGSMKIGDKLGIGLAGTYGACSAYSGISSSGSSTGEFIPKEFKLGGGISYEIIDNISAGLTICYLNETLTYNNKYGAITADLSVSAKLSDDILASAGAKALGSGVKSEDGTSYQLPSSAFAGILWDKELGQSSSLKVTADADLFFKDGISVSAGAEYGIRNMAFIRTGFRYGGNTVLSSCASAGLGFRISGIRLDFAFVAGMGQIKSNGILAGLGYSF